MSTAKRLRLAGAGLSLAAVIACTHVWGDGAKGTLPLQTIGGGESKVALPQAGDSLVAAKFAQQPVVSYKTESGDAVFGAQIKPDLGPAVEMPRDILVLVDTAALQAGDAYKLSREMTKLLNQTLKASDQISIWTVNIPEASRDLTSGFREPKSDKVAEAINKLDTVEYASGVADLKTALRKAIKEFDVRAGRQSAIVYFGDGFSNFNPISSTDRYQLAQDLVAQKIAFFAVPLGSELEPMNLHGFASTTGGAVVRLNVNEKSIDSCNRLLQTVSAPILYPTRFTLADGIAEAYPTKLPPLRGDYATLMIGRMKGDSFGLSIEGTVAGKPVQVEVREKATAPEADNFFLTNMLRQWSEASNKAAPALIRADRALAYAYQQAKLTHEEYLTQAHWALGESRVDVAEKLFILAQKVDPTDREATEGLAVVEKVKVGRLNGQQLKSAATAAKEQTVRPDGNMDGKAERLDLNKLLVLAEQQPPQGGAAPADPAAPQGGVGEDLLKTAKQQQILNEQQVTEAVDKTIRNAKQMLNGDPDGSYNLLKRQFESVQNTGGIGDPVKAKLSAQLEGQMRDVELRGRQIKLRLEEEEARRILVIREQLGRENQERAEERIRERVRAFTNLMDKARYEEAYKEANLLREESINLGRPIPVEATASYKISLSAMNLKELLELKRIREERFLLTMMQVEKSHVPYPDEPPVHFPPAATWKELTKLRSKRYGYYSFGPKAGENYNRVIDRLNSPMKPSIDQGIELPMSSWLQQFMDNLQGTNFYIRPNDESLKADAGGTGPIKLYGDESPRIRIPAMPGATLGSVITAVLAQQGLTYFVNEDHIEILKKAHAKKSVNFALRVYEVADLVIGIPQALNTYAIGQQLAVLGGVTSFGSAGSPLNAFGNSGAAGGFAALNGFGLQGALGGFGGGMAGLGGGMLGAGGGGMLGAGGGGMLGAGGGMLGAGGQGGLLGAGGQAGQSGFSFLGAGAARTFEYELTHLIMDTIGPGRWYRPTNITTPQQFQPTPGQNADTEEASALPVDEQYNLGYYPPALALVVRAPSHYRPYVKDPNAPATADSGAMGANFPKGNGANQLAGGGKGGNNKVAAADQKAFDDLKNAHKGKNVTARQWQEALAKSDINPEHRAGVVLAATKLLGQLDEFKSVVDVLKSNLRLGIVNEPWVFEALTIALMQSGGGKEDLMRARLSCIDLDPKNPQSYLEAAKVVAEAGDVARALSFCRVASNLSPETAAPYAEALGYSEKLPAVDADAVRWSVSNLLRRDWVVDKDLYYAQANKALTDACDRLRAEKRSAEADKLQAAIVEQQRRDLVIELAWQDAADLDLSVFEPINTTCSATNPRTPAGSVLVSDDMKERKETYTVAEGFNGTYVVKVNRVWGHPMGGTAQVKVVKHQGMPNQQIEYHTVAVDHPTDIKVVLSKGRRTELATVPPPVVAGDKIREMASNNQHKSWERLRALSDPMYRAEEIVRSSGVGATGSKDQVYDASRTPSTTARLTYSTAVQGFDHIGMSMEMKYEVDPASGEMHVKVLPAFDAVQTLKNDPAWNNPLIPGAK